MGKGMGLVPCLPAVLTLCGDQPMCLGGHSCIWLFGALYAVENAGLFVCVCAGCADSAAGVPAPGEEHIAGVQDEQECGSPAAGELLVLP